MPCSFTVGVLYCCPRGGSHRTASQQTVTLQEQHGRGLSENCTARLWNVGAMECVSFTQFERHKLAQQKQRPYNCFNFRINYYPYSSSQTCCTIGKQSQSVQKKNTLVGGWRRTTSAATHSCLVCLLIELRLSNGSTMTMQAVRRSREPLSVASSCNHNQVFSSEQANIEYRILTMRWIC